MKFLPYCLAFLVLFGPDLFNSNTAQAQGVSSSHRYSFWEETNFFGHLTADKKWQYQVDYQYRRMSDASTINGGQHYNIFKDPYQQVLRPWIHYWIKPGAIRFSLSPLGYWATWLPPQEPQSTPEGKSAVGQRVFFPEFRVCPQVTLVQKFGRFEVIQRYRYEFRWLGQKTQVAGDISDFGDGYNFGPNGAYGSNHAGRIRYQLRCQFPLNNAKIEKKTFYVNAWNELFLAVGKNTPVNRIFNQNRLIALLGYKFNTEYPIRVEAGVTYQALFQYSAGAVNVENNTALTVYLIFDEFHTLFKSKKTQQADKLPEEKK